MKVAKLPSGAELKFPDDTSEEVIKATVKRILGVEDGPSVEDVLDQLSSALTERDKVDFYGPAAAEQGKVIKSVSKDIISSLKKLDKKQKDDFGPAMQKHGGLLDKLVMNFAGIFVKNAQEDRKVTEVSAKELAKQVVILSNNVEILTSKIDRNALLLVKAQDQNTQAIRELVKAYKSPRTILRDDDGKAKGIH